MNRRARLVRVCGSFALAIWGAIGCALWGRLWGPIWGLCLAYLGGFYCARLMVSTRQTEGYGVGAIGGAAMPENL